MKRIITLMALLGLLFCGCANYRHGDGVCAIREKRHYLWFYQVYAEAKDGLWLNCTKEQYDRLEEGQTWYCEWAYQGIGKHGELSGFYPVAEESP